MSESRDPSDTILNVPDRPAKRSLYERIRARVEPIGGIDLDLPPREPTREPPRFE